MKPEFIPIFEPHITKHEFELVYQALDSGYISSVGKFVKEFEIKFAEYVGTKYALSTSSGTTALHLSLLAAGIREGDDVIVPDLTFIATANAVKYCGANPVFIDVDKKTLCIDYKKIEKIITKNTKAIIPVHLYGHPTNMDEILTVAKKYNLFVIEDAAEAHGAEYYGKKVGSIGDCGVFSFYGNKIMTTGEGGMITTNDKFFYELSLYLRDQAMDESKRYWHSKIGFNYRMTNLQAALGVAQLSRINEFIEKKIHIYHTYKKFLNNNLKIKLNSEAKWAKNVYWAICVEIDGYNVEKRNDLMDRLKTYGIDSRPYFYPISDMPMYENSNTPVAHSVYQKGINLPSYYNLKDDQIKYICVTIIRILNEN